MYLVSTGILAIEIFPPEMAVSTDRWRQNIDAASGSRAIVNLLVKSPALKQKMICLYKEISLKYIWRSNIPRKKYLCSLA
jgi:hypothetical protein